MGIEAVHIEDLKIFKAINMGPTQKCLAKRLLDSPPKAGMFMYVPVKIIGMETGSLIISQPLKWEYAFQCVVHVCMYLYTHTSVYIHI